MLQSQLEILAQGTDYLTNISAQRYCEVITPNFISSAGAHMRHILDHYSAIMLAKDDLIINYDCRLRGAKVETEPALALLKISEICHWLHQLTPDDLNHEVTLSTEISIASQQVAQVKTTIARELVFAASHAVHHYAMIAQISLAQQHQLPPFFGIAPATATFLRQQQSH